MQFLGVRSFWITDWLDYWLGKWVLQKLVGLLPFKP